MIVAAEVLATNNSKTLDIFSVNLEECPEISRAASVYEPALVVFKDGREVTRYAGAHIDQIEYVVSRVLCGLIGPNGEFPVETRNIGLGAFVA